MRILVIGAGAIGCLVGGKLALHGEAVTLAGRPRFAQAVAEKGLQLIDGQGTSVAADLVATASIAAAFLAQEGAESAPGYDVVILTVKSYDSTIALQELNEALTLRTLPTPVVLSLQNGVGNEEEIADLFGDANVLAGTITTPVSVVAPGVIRIDKARFSIGMASWSPEPSNGRLQKLASVFTQSGFEVTQYADARSMKWTKLLMNMIGNASSAILDLPPDQLFANPLLVDLEIRALREALAVMRGLGIAPVNVGSYPFALLAPLIRFAPRAWLRPILRSRIGAARGGKMPSLHIELESAKGKSEVQWLNGAVARHGDRAGVRTPVNSALSSTLDLLTRGELERSELRGNVDALQKRIELS